MSSPTLPVVFYSRPVRIQDPGHHVGKDDRHVWVMIRGVQLILASHVPLHWAIGPRDRWLHCVCGASGDTIECRDLL